MTDDRLNAAVHTALVNRAGSGTMTDRYIRERVVPGFLKELERLGYKIVATEVSAAS